MRVTVVTKIFPNSLEPLSAPFNRHQIAELARRCDVDVLVAVPHVPFSGKLGIPARAARLTALPARERVHGIDVTYVRQLYVPRIGGSVAVPLYLASLLPHRDRLRLADVVLATWAYPDGCAAIVAARAVGAPCVVKVHGSDVNVVLQRGAARGIASRLLPRASAVVTVSRPLASEVMRLGVPTSRVHVVDNGVDSFLFRRRDRAAARHAVGADQDARIVLFVGRLEPQKGITELLGAFAKVREAHPRAMLVLIGDGVQRREVCDRALELGGAVRVLGPLPQVEVATWMGACDLLTLPSWGEGMPNVVFEALATGRPVVATAVGGIPDALADPCAGIVVPAKNEGALAEALRAALGRSWDEAAVRACGPAPWSASADALYAVLAKVVARTPSTRTRSRVAKNGRGATSGNVQETPRTANIF